MIKADIVADIDEITIPQAVWDSLLASGNTNTTFQNRDWLRVWLRTVGSSTEPFIIRLMDEERIVGIIPLVIVPSSMGPLTLRTLQFAGQPQADYSEFLVLGDKTGCLNAMLSCILDHQQRWDFAAFDHLCEGTSNLQCFIDVLRDSAVTYQVLMHDVLPYAEIGASFEDYWSRRSRKMRYDIGKKERGLALLGKVTFKRYQGYEALPFLDSFIEMLKVHDAYKERMGSKRSYEQDRSFLSEMMRDSNFEPYVHFSSLNLDDIPIAYHFGFADSQALYYYKSAYSTEYAKYSSSRLLIKQLILDCVQSRIGTLDFMLGNEQYKYSWTTSERRCYDVRVFHKGWKSQIARLWLVDIRPRLKQNGVLVDLVKAVQGLRCKVGKLWPH